MRSLSFDQVYTLALPSRKLTDIATENPPCWMVFTRISMRDFHGRKCEFQGRGYQGFPQVSQQKSRTPMDRSQPPSPDHHSIERGYPPSPAMPPVQEGVVVIGQTSKNFSQHNTGKEHTQNGRPPESPTVLCFGIPFNHFGFIDSFGGLGMPNRYAPRVCWGFLRKQKHGHLVGMVN